MTRTVRMFMSLRVDRFIRDQNSCRFIYTAIRVEFGAFCVIAYSCCQVDDLNDTGLHRMTCGVS